VWLTVRSQLFGPTGRVAPCAERVTILEGVNCPAEQTPLSVGGGSCGGFSSA
jgi:hypothetical protein